MRTGEIHGLQEASGIKSASGQTPQVVGQRKSDHRLSPADRNSQTEDVPPLVEVGRVGSGRGPFCCRISKLIQARLDTAVLYDRVRDPYCTVFASRAPVETPQVATVFDAFQYRRGFPSEVLDVWPPR